MTTAEDLPALIASVEVPAFENLADARLVAGQRAFGEARRLLDALAAEWAGEIARRSTRERGYDGLAQRLGARNATVLVQQLTGSTSRDAAELVSAVAEPDSVTDAVRAGTLSVGQASAIRSALDGLATEHADAATGALLDRVAGLSVEQTRVQARSIRDDLDAEGILHREEAQRDRRYLHLYPQPDGMTRLAGLLDPESAAIVSSVVDAATSPRRGGPRFVDSDAKARADAIVADPRRTEQLALDAVVGVIQAGAAADPQMVPGARGAAVQVIVHGERAQFEGREGAVSYPTALRLACTEGLEQVAIDARGRVLRLGSTQRRFSLAQRRALAARDGGCRYPGCTRPPSWTEAHHVLSWSRGGPTDIDNGMLLCRFHHLLVHNNGWRIEGDGGRFWLIPPPDIDARQRRIPMPSRNPLTRAKPSAERLLSSA